MNEIGHKIGLGSVQFGIPYGISNTTGKTTPEEVRRILDYASENHIEVIDTASSYGTAESVLGNLHKGRFQIISKFMPSQTNGSTRDQLEKSLQNLRINYLYGFMAHRPNLLQEKDWEELSILKKEGKIKKIGFSLNSPAEFDSLMISGFFPDIVQVPFNYFDNRFKNILIQLKSNGCEIHTRSTFLQGLFFMNPNILNSFFDELKEEIRILQETYGKKLQHALLQYVVQQDFIDKVIIGVESLNQLQENLKTHTFENEMKNCVKTYPEEILMPVNWPKN